MTIFGIIVVLLERFFGVVGLVRGWSSAMIAELFIGGVQLICMGLIGEYVGRIYGESKRRPLYIVRERMGFETRNVAAGSRQQAVAFAGKGRILLPDDSYMPGGNINQTREAAFHDVLAKRT